MKQEFWNSFDVGRYNRENQRKRTLDLCMHQITEAYYRNNRNEFRLSCSSNLSNREVSMLEIMLCLKESMKRKKV